MLTFIDLFSGCGGWSTGLRAAGLEHVVGVELDTVAASSYAANHGAVIQKDIKEVTFEDFTPFLQGRQLDILVASPPCQSFSNASRGARHTAVDSDNLYLEVIRIAELLLPEWLVLENVVGFSSKKINGNLTALDDLTNHLMVAGFARIESRVLCATQYEVPQKRKRLIVIARRTPGGPIPWPAAVEGYDTSISRFIQPHDTVPDYYFMSTEKQLYYEERHARMPSHVRFADLTKPAHTIRASLYKSRGAEFLIVQDGRIRMPTERELAAIQTFPENYKFQGGHTAICKQIGNAVPPRMAFHIGTEIRKASEARRTMLHALGRVMRRDSMQIRDWAQTALMNNFQ